MNAGRRARRPVDELWEQHLTARDLEHLRVSTWSKAQPFGLGERPCLLLVDAYVAAVGHERRPLLESVVDWPLSCGMEGWAAIDRAATVLSAARAAAIDVVHTVGLSAMHPSDPDRAARFTPSAAVPAEVRERGGEIVGELSPAPGETVIAKPAASAFFGTALDALLRSWGNDTLVVCGETTSGCVRATVVDAKSLGYQVAIVADGTFDRTEASHAINPFDMHHKYGDVVWSDDAVAYLARVGAEKAGTA